MIREALRLLWLEFEDWAFRVTHAERIDHDPDVP